VLVWCDEPGPAPAIDRRVTPAPQGRAWGHPGLRWRGVGRWQSWWRRL